MNILTDLCVHFPLLWHYTSCWYSTLQCVVIHTYIVPQLVDMLLINGHLAKLPYL